MFKAYNIEYKLFIFELKVIIIMRKPINNDNKDSVKLKEWHNLGTNKSGITIYCSEVANEYPQAEHYRHIIQFLLVANNSLMFWPLYYANDLLKHHDSFPLHAGNPTYMLETNQLQRIKPFLKAVINCK